MLAGANDRIHDILVSICLIGAKREKSIDNYDSFCFRVVGYAR